jgi:hypothetical protein
MKTIHRSSALVLVGLFVGAAASVTAGYAKDAPPTEWLKWSTVAPAAEYDIIFMPMSLVQVYDTSFVKDPIGMSINEAQVQVNNQCKDRGGDAIIGAGFNYVYYPGGGAIANSEAKIIAYGTCVKMK